MGAKKSRNIINVRLAFYLSLTANKECQEISLLPHQELWLKASASSTKVKHSTLFRDNFFSKSWLESKYWSSWYNKEGRNGGFLALLLTCWKSYLEGDESKEPFASSWTALVLVTDEGEAITVGSAKVGRFFCLLSEGQNIVGWCITYKCHMAPLDNAAVVKNNTWTP